MFRRRSGPTINVFDGIGGDDKEGEHMRIRIRTTRRPKRARSAIALLATVLVAAIAAPASSAGSVEATAAAATGDIEVTNIQRISGASPFSDNCGDPS